MHGGQAPGQAEKAEQAGAAAQTGQTSPSDTGNVAERRPEQASGAAESKSAEAGAAGPEGDDQSGDRAEDSSQPQAKVRAPGGLASWRVLAATRRGAAHDLKGLPNQDAVATCCLPGGVAVAVADGHGHSRHFRSARGSRMAVTVALQVAAELAGSPAGLALTPVGEDGIRHLLVPELLRRWRDAVRADLAADPVTPAEDMGRWTGDDETVAYGTTLLLAIVCGSRLLLAQVGDGDIVAVRSSGTALRPVPGDPRLNGRHTTSMCTKAAEGAFRAAVVDLDATDLAAVLLATDGYANAQAAHAWEDAVSADLAKLIRERQPGWLAGQLPGWAARCASVDGSADDTTIALLLAPSAGPTGPGQSRQAGPHGQQSEPAGPGQDGPAKPWPSIPERAGPGLAGPERAEPERAEPERAEPERAEPERAEPERAEPERAAPGPAVAAQSPDAGVS